MKKICPCTVINKLLLQWRSLKKKKDVHSKDSVFVNGRRTKKSTFSSPNVHVYNKPTREGKREEHKIKQAKKSYRNSHAVSYVAQKWEEPKLNGRNNIKETLRTTEYCISTHDWIRSGWKGGLGGLPSCQRQGVVGVHVFMMSLHIGVMVFSFFFFCFFLLLMLPK